MRLVLSWLFGDQSYVIMMGHCVPLLYERVVPSTCGYDEVLCVIAWLRGLFPLHYDEALCAIVCLRALFPLYCEGCSLCIASSGFPFRSPVRCTEHQDEMSSSTVKTLTRPLRLLFHPHIGAPAVGESSPLINGQLAVVPTPAFQFYYAFSSSASTTIPSSVGGGTALAASSSPHSQDIQRGIWSKLLLFVPGAVTFGLGTWQIFRREEKIKMLDYRKGRLDLEPIKLTSTSSTENLDDLEFRRVVCRGSFDEKRSIFVGPRSRSISGVTNNGYYVITPLMPVPGDPGSVQSPVLVNRGWVPQSWRDDLLEASKMHEQPTNASPPASKVERTSWWRSWFRKPERDEEQASVTASVEVVGVVRGSEKPSIFVPANDSHSGQWFYIDVPAIVRSCSLPENTIYVENINANVNHSHPYPVPKDANSLIRSSVMPQDHLNYTLTWYSLSAAVTFMAFKRIRPKKSRNRK